MCRTQPVIDDSTAQRILDAAIDKFCEQGFAGTSLRDIARAAETPVSRIYDHYPSKRALLEEIVHAGYDRLLAQTLAALADAPHAPAAQLEALVWTHCDFHVRHARASVVAQTDWRSLSAASRERVLVKRRRLQDLLCEIVADGAELGCFSVGQPRAVSRALLTMCAAIATWHDKDGLQSPRRIAQTYCDLAANMVGVEVAGAARDAIQPVLLGAAA